MSLRWRDREAVLPADACSTRRLMAAFGLWTALIYGFFGGPRATWFDRFNWYIEVFLSGFHAAALGLVLGWIQHGILAGRRWKVGTWVRWTFLATLAGNWITLAGLQGIPLWKIPAARETISGALWSVSFGLLLGLALAAALWKKDWPREAWFWVLGRAGFCVLGWSAAASLDWIRMPDDTLLIRSLLLAAKGVVAGAIEGAGAAWLLDRLYFRPPV